MKALEFPQLCSEPTKIYRDGKQGIFEFLLLFLQIDLPSRAVDFKSDLERES
jgi:hypothetical protein